VDNAHVSFLTPLIHGAAGTFHLRNERTGAPVATTILPALDSAARRTGLLKHASLAAGAAMIIAPTSAIHTFFMRFPIDVAFVTRDGTIVKTCRALAAWRLAWAFGAYAVVEMPAGALDRADTRTGDRLVLSRAEPRP
jgi:uncharacterized membrane protein (UPF0127 family)